LSEDFLERLRNLQKPFIDEFIRSFLRYDTAEDAEAKLLSCCAFCAMLGLEKLRHCKIIVQATCGLSKCSFVTEEINQVMGYALVNLNRKIEYLTELDARQRAHTAVCHLYIAQAILYDDFADMRYLCKEIYQTTDTAPFFARVLTVMKTWKHRVMVSAEEQEKASKVLMDLLDP
jgi:hypothetical protein